LTPGDIKNKESIFAGVKVILSQLEIPLESVIEAGKIAKKNGNTFILNPAPARELPDELLQLVDFTTPNESELELLTGIEIKDEQTARDGAKALLKRGVKNVVVTLGEVGALFVNGTTSTMFPANKVRVVDTTGAGDAFNGAFAYYISEGYEINKVIKAANIVASLSVMKMGAQSSMPGKEDLPADIIS